MFKELTSAPFTMKFLWLLHKSDCTRYGSEDPLVFHQHLTAIRFFVLEFIIASSARLCFTLYILTMSSACLHEHKHVCHKKKETVAARCIHDIHRCALESKRTGGGGFDGKQQEEMHHNVLAVRHQAVQHVWEFRRSTRRSAERDSSG